MSRKEKIKKIVTPKKWSPLAAILFAAVIASVGYLTYRLTSAAVTPARSTYEVSIGTFVYGFQPNNPYSGGQALGGVDVSISNWGELNNVNWGTDIWVQCIWGSNPDGTLTQPRYGGATSWNSNGFLNWAKCPIGVSGGQSYYHVNGINKAGWSVRGDSPIKPGSVFKVGKTGTIEPLNPAPGANLIWLVENDNDGDGLGNTHDGCPNSAGPTTNNGCPLPAAPQITSFTYPNAPNAITYGTATTLSWKSSNTSTCGIGVKSGSNYVAVITSQSSNGSWTTPKLTSTQTYLLSCVGNGGTTSSTRAVYVAAAPQPSGGGSTPSGGGGGGGGSAPSTPVGTVRTGGSTKKVATDTAPGTNITDKEPPSAPKDLKAEMVGASVDLTWSASTDNVGVTGYIIERSVDKNSWETISTLITDTSYLDSDTAFDQKYSYRVYAQDAAGNNSEAAVTDIKTGSFEANVKTDSESTVTGADGAIKVTFPAGAVSEDLYCEIVEDDNSKGLVPNELKAVLGPYNLSCKTKDGLEVTSFNEKLQWEINLKDKKVAQPQLYLYDTNWNSSDLKYDSSNKQFKFESDIAQPVLVLSAKKSSSTGTVIALVVGILVVFVLFLLFRKWLKNQGSHDDDTTGGTPVGTTGSSGNYYSTYYD